MFNKLSNLIKNNLVSEATNLLINSKSTLSDILIEVPSSDSIVNYTRNNVHFSETIDCFIHAIKPEGRTMIHAHGLGDVIIMPLDGDLHFNDYHCAVGYKYPMSECRVSRGHIKAGDVYHKNNGVDLIHCVHNESNKLVKFFEVYKKPYDRLPLYVSDFGQNHLMQLDFGKYEFQVNLDFVMQILNSATKIYDMSSTMFKLEYQNHIDCHHHVFDFDGRLITNALQLDELLSRTFSTILRIYTYMDIVLIQVL